MEGIVIGGQHFLWIPVSPNMDCLSLSAVNITAVKHNSCQGQHIFGETLLVNS